MSRGPLTLKVHFWVLAEANRGAGVVLGKGV